MMYFSYSDMLRCSYTCAAFSDSLGFHFDIFVVISTMILMCQLGVLLCSLVFKVIYVFNFHYVPTWCHVM
jgi:hypothetical protein